MSNVKYGTNTKEEIVNKEGTKNYRNSQSLPFAHNLYEQKANDKEQKVSTWMKKISKVTKWPQV